MTSTVYVAKSVYGGDGLGRLGDGRVVFVQGAWAGENVKAEIVEEKRHYVKARLVEVVDGSPDRISGGDESGIPGCVYAGLSFTAECAAKEEQLKDFFERARIHVGEFIGFGKELPSPLHYRNKAVYHFARQHGKWVIGYRTEPSHEILDISTDPLVVKPINDKLPEIRASVVRLLTTGPEAVRRDIERKGNVTVRWTAKSGVKWWIGDAPKDMVLKETTCGRDFEVPGDGFYQVNPEIGEQLVRAVVEEYQKGAATAPDVLDLYCGVGVFGLCCRPPKLIGIESGRQAIDFAIRNAASFRQPNARFFAEQVGRNLNRIPAGGTTTVIVDPPRGGMEPNVPKWLAQLKAPRIFYISCDPATLTRDLRTIVSGYEVESVRGFNMFPRTARFETFVTLRKKVKG